MRLKCFGVSFPSRGPSGCIFRLRQRAWSQPQWQQWCSTYRGGLRGREELPKRHPPYTNTSGGQFRITFFQMFYDGIVNISIVVSICSGQTHSGPRAVTDGGPGSFAWSDKQLELPHLHHDGENQRKMWTNPQSGENVSELQWVTSKKRSKFRQRKMQNTENYKLLFVRLFYFGYF